VRYKAEDGSRAAGLKVLSPWSMDSNKVGLAGRRSLFRHSLMSTGRGFNREVGINQGGTARKSSRPCNRGEGFFSFYTEI
jgi:hypothetical protein